VVFSIALFAVLNAAPANAPIFTPGDAETRRFKEAFERGEALFKEGDFGAAVANFREADHARMTPEVAYDLARCHERLGDQAFSILYYRLYMRRAPNAPDTLEVAERVGTALAKAEADGRGFLELDAPRASNLTIAGHTFVDGPVAMFMAPGEYEVTGEFPGGKRKMSVQIRTGRTATVTFEPSQPPMLPVERALSAELIAAGKTEPSTGPSGLRVGSYVTAAAGLAVIVGGIAMGAASQGDANQLKTDRTLTISQAKDLAGSANTKGLLANVFFGVGGAAIAGGVVMWVFSMPEPGMKASAP
jgi:hypothetical protein